MGFLLRVLIFIIDDRTFLEKIKAMGEAHIANKLKILRNFKGEVKDRVQKKYNYFRNFFSEVEKKTVQRVVGSNPATFIQRAIQNKKEEFLNIFHPEERKTFERALNLKKSVEQKKRLKVIEGVWTKMQSTAIDRAMFVANSVFFRAGTKNNPDTAIQMYGTCWIHFKNGKKEYAYYNVLFKTFDDMVTKAIPIEFQGAWTIFLQQYGFQYLSTRSHFKDKKFYAFLKYKSLLKNQSRKNNMAKKAPSFYKKIPNKWKVKKL